MLLMLVQVRAVCLRLLRTVDATQTTAVKTSRGRGRHSGTPSRTCTGYESRSWAGSVREGIAAGVVAAS